MSGFLTRRVAGLAKEDFVVFRNRLNLSAAIDRVAEEYDNRNISGDVFPVLHEYLSSGEVESFIEIPPKFRIMPAINKQRWSVLTSVLFRELFEYENDEFTLLLVDRDDYAEEIVSAILPKDFTGKTDEVAELIKEYMNVIPSSVEIFVYEDELNRKLAKIPINNNKVELNEIKKGGAPEKDRGWYFVIATFFIERYFSMHHRDPTDNDVMDFLHQNTEILKSSRAQISDQTFLKELPELKRRRIALIESFKNKYQTE